MTEIKTETKELKPKSFRIDDETHEKFKEISNSIGGNQQDAFEQLIEAYELQQGKLALKEEGVNVEQFEKYLKCLLRIYIANVEDKQHIRATVQTEYEEELKSKDKKLNSKDELIQDLQEQLKKAEEEKKEAIIKLTASKEEMERLNQHNIEQEKNHKIELKNLESDYNAKKDELNDKLKGKEELLEKCEKLNSTLEKQMKEKLEQLEQLKNDYDTLQVDFNAQEDKHEEIITHMKQHETEAVQRAEREAELKHKEILAEFKEKKQKEIDEYQNKYLALLERLEQMKNVPATEQQEKNK